MFCGDGKPEQREGRFLVKDIGDASLLVSCLKMYARDDK